MQFHNYINCYLELAGMHRFNTDHDWGLILMRFRNGELTEQDIDTINQRCIQNDVDIPADIQYATYSNKDRAAINTGLFHKFCHDHAQDNQIDNAMMLFSNDLSVI